MELTKTFYLEIGTLIIVFASAAVYFYLATKMLFSIMKHISEDKKD
jgi:hypothetical protein